MPKGRKPDSTRPLIRKLGPDAMPTPAYSLMIADAIRRGETLKEAAWGLGIPHNAVRRWLAEGEDESLALPPHDPRREFAASIRHAEGVLRIKAVGVLHKVMDRVDDDPGLALQASKFYLERTQGEFNPKVKTEISGPDGDPIRLAALSLSPADLRKEVLRLAQENSLPLLPGVSGEEDGDPDA